MKISLIITADTRQGAQADSTKIGEFQGEPLCGCRSLDYLTSGVINKMAYTGVHEIETIVCVDVHEPIPPDTLMQMRNLTDLFGVKYILKSADRKRHRFNDFIYVEALKHATGDYVMKWDSDVAAFRRPEFMIVEQYRQWLDQGYSYVCQPTQIEAHGMSHASTRFFICKRETLDAHLPELEKCLWDYNYFQNKYPGIHAPCTEHFLGAFCSGKVLYPMQENENYIIYSWVTYHAGTLAKMNTMNYDQIYDLVFNQWSGPLGASDVISQPIP